MKQRITLKFIAEKAGVNQATVSRALNPETASLISEKVRNDIQKICDEYGYRPSLRGRSIVTGKTFKIGMILGDMQKDFAAHDWARIICSLSSELQKHNYALTLLHADGTESMDKQVKNFLMSGVADGYVSGPSMFGSEVFALLKKLAVPLWTICKNYNKIDSINCILRDDMPCLQEIWNKIPAENRKRCAFFASKNAEIMPRIADIEKAAELVCPDNDYYVERILFGRASTFSAMEYRDAFKAANDNIERIKSHKIIWCESDFIAHALYDVLEMHNIKAGKDIHIIGYGDFETYTRSDDEPILTTISADTEQIGITLARAIMAEINGNTVSQQIINAKFIQRKTFTF